MRVCSIDGCDKKHYAKGLCTTHYYYSNNGNICSVEGCNNKCKAHGFCKKHWARIERNGHLEISKREKGTGTITPKGYLVKKVNGSDKKEHILVAERILGRPLPEGALVHHVDGNKLNNSPNNLVICPSVAYHNMIHRRQKALEECGNADYWQCFYCRQYDDPINMYMSNKGPNFHRSCRSAASRKYG